jgi:hypothetical protein
MDVDELELRHAGDQYGVNRRLPPQQWRSIENFVANSATGEVIYTPPRPFEAPALMADLVEWRAPGVSAS